MKPDVKIYTLFFHDVLLYGYFQVPFLRILCPYTNILTLLILKIKHYLYVTQTLENVKLINIMIYYTGYFLKTIYDKKKL
ncbi:hypothetical protein PFAG_03108 [Plasmodium falciparum Santa Lucia]|uniref:Uncharacterized protein n=2 Tax=Plasmodium falciparum TaxID=5833 RepID=W7FTG8_PLAFA|nr:hypothetical protein PFNF135_03265 [Plasmodium falciparum NF135/5.C10]EUT84018.1 hypothetical protein PFAG_03108 [Plasmodium falciparum Santa Lucia]